MGDDESFSYEVTTRTGEKKTRTISKSSRGRTRTITTSGTSGTETVVDYGSGFRERTSSERTTTQETPTTTPLPESQVRSQERPEVLESIKRQQSIARQSIATKKELQAARQRAAIISQQEKIKELKPPSEAAAGTPNQQETIKPTFEYKQKQKYGPTVQAATNVPSKFSQEKTSFNEKILGLLGKDKSPGFSYQTPKFTPKEALLSPVYAGTSFAQGFVESGVNFVKGITVDVDKTLQGATDIIQGKTTLTDISEAQRQSFINDPFKFAGGVTFDAAGTNILARGVRGARNVYVKTGAKYIPEEIIVSEQVTSGEASLPKTSSTAESLRKFNEEAGGYAISASPQKLKSNIAGESRKSELGLEDPGIYVTPISDASPAFLRLQNIDSSSGYSFIPFKPIIEAFQQPTFTVFKTKGATTLPERVSRQPGFESVKKFFDERTPTGEIFITKRSQIGTGDLPRQKYTSPSSFNMRGQIVDQGDVILEWGTSELEGVVPSGQGFTPITSGGVGSLKGYNVYTRIQGQNIPLRFVETTDNTPSQNTLLPSQKVISAETIRSESSIPVRKELSYSFSPSPTTKSLTGLETDTLTSFTPNTSDASSVPSRPLSDLSRGFVPPATSQPTSTSIKSRIITPNISYSPSSSSRSSRSRGGFSSSLTTPRYESISSSPSYSSFPSSIVRRASSSRTSKPSFTRGYPVSPPNTRYSQLKTPSLLSKESNRSGFTVQVLEKGKFVTIGRRETKQKAIGLGKFNVGGSAKRSFRVLERGKPIKAEESRELRAKKRDPFTFVERTAFAINTPGEVFQIPGAKRRQKR